MQIQGVLVPVMVMTIMMTIAIVVMGVVEFRNLSKRKANLRRIGPDSLPVGNMLPAGIYLNRDSGGAELATHLAQSHPIQSGRTKIISGHVETADMGKLVFQKRHSVRTGTLSNAHRSQNRSKVRVSRVPPLEVPLVKIYAEGATTDESIV